MRLPTFNKPRIIACGEDLANHIALPLGCLAEVMELFEAHHIKPDIRDEPCRVDSIDVKFCAHPKSRARIRREYSAAADSERRGDAAATKLRGLTKNPETGSQIARLSWAT
jgi:hypothetical protein